MYLNSKRVNVLANIKAALVWGLVSPGGGGKGGGETLRDVAGPPRPSLASYGDKSGLGRIQPVMKTPYARVDVPT